MSPGPQAPWPEGAPQSHQVLLSSGCRYPHSDITSWYLSPSQLRGSPLYSKVCGSLPALPQPQPQPRGSPSMAAGCGFKSPCQSSSVPPFRTQPAIRDTCQHPRVTPSLMVAILGVHRCFPTLRSQSTLTSLLPRRCHLGYLPPVTSQGQVPCQPPCLGDDHSYFTYLCSKRKVLHVFGNHAVV